MSNDTVRAGATALPKLDPSIGVLAALVVSDAMHRGSSKRLKRALEFIDAELWRARKAVRAGGDDMPPPDKMEALRSARNFLCKVLHIADQRIERGC